MIWLAIVLASAALATTCILFALELQTSLRIRSVVIQEGERVSLFWAVRSALRVAVQWPLVLAVEFCVWGGRKIEQLLGVDRGE